jgi:LysM repeat protein
LYSPVHYHFSRMQAHETNAPLNVWLGLAAIVGIVLAVLLVVALPGLLTHTRSNAVASPSFTSTTSQFVVPPVGPTPTPTTTDGPSASPSVAPGPSFRTYKVQVGDTITRIANKFGLKTWELLLANPGLTTKSTLQINRVLNIPKPGQLTPPP